MKIVRISAILLLIIPCVSALADHVTLSARWDGSESLVSALQGTCNDAGDLALRQFNPIQVSTSGTYHLGDASDALPGDLMIAVYAGDVDAAATRDEPIAAFGDGGPVNLEAGQNYTVAVQHWCKNIFPASFAVSLSGPGDITGADVVVSPGWTLGYIDESNPTAVFSEEPRGYAASETVKVPATGLYHFADVALSGRLDSEIRVYKDFFNSADTEMNLVARLDDSGDVALVSGMNYQFVVVARTEGNSGEWHWVMFPPGDLGINAGFSGNWYNEETSGQGMLIDVMPEKQLVFAAWFTYELQRPAAADDAVIGDTGHRWFTALGSYEQGDKSITLNITNTTGGVFDSADPPVSRQSGYGTIELEFSDCLNASMTYSLPAGPVDEINPIPLTRAVIDHVPLCAILGTTGPDVITN
jgi:hypothetical protein